MTYNEFTTQVRRLLYKDADNPDTMVQELIDQSIRSWAGNMQGLIDTYKVKNVNTFASTDFTTECRASQGDLPAGCDLTEIIIYTPDENTSDDLTCPEPHYPKYYPWEKRFSLINGEVECYSVTVDPDMTEFYVYPVIEEGDSVKVLWDGLKNDYSGDDEVQWNVDAIPCCAAYVNARIAEVRDEKIQRAREFDRQYETLKRRVYLNEDKRRKAKRTGTR